MSKIEIVILVIVVGVQVIRALRKRMGGEGSESPEPISTQEEPDWMEERDSNVPEPSREERLRIPAAASEPAVFLPLSRPRPVQARMETSAGQAVRTVSKREQLRQRLLGKVILDPPPGAAMLRRFRP